MKILEPQSAVLTNYEVYTHLVDQRTRYEARTPKRRGPGNLETIVKEMLSYLRSPPSPLGNNPFPYNSTTIRTLLERLRPYDLTKAEILVILNLRPTSRETLSVVVEECDARFPDQDVQDQIMMIIAGVLGAPSDADRTAMKDTAEDARVRNDGMKAREASEMDVDEPPMNS